MLTFAPATQSDIQEFFGNVPASMKAICGKRDGVPVFIVGIVLERLQARYFSEYKDLSCAELSRCWRGAIMSLKYVVESKRPVVAVAENDHGHKNLTRLGFVNIGDDYYQWPGE